MAGMMIDNGGSDDGLPISDVKFHWLELLAWKLGQNFGHQGILTLSCSYPHFVNPGYQVGQLQGS